MYDAVASSESAVWVEQLSITAELLRPVLQTEEAAEWSAVPVSSRAASSFRPAHRPNSSIDSLVCLANPDAVSVSVSNFVKMCVQTLGRFLQRLPRNAGHAGLHCDSRGRQTGSRGHDRLEQRRLHFLAQHLHLAEDRYCRVALFVVAHGFVKRF